MHSGKLSIENMLKNSIIAWIPIERDVSVLCVNVNPSADAIFDMRGVRADYRCGGQIAELISNGNKYDYIFAFEVLEKAAEPIELLKKIRILLNEGGTFYLGTDNRLGLRYFCGDIDNSTGKSLSGIQQYNNINIDSLEYRLYAKDEIEYFLLQAGMENAKFYSVLPNLEAAQLVYSHDYLPEERLATRYIPMYHDPSRIFLREEWIYDSLIKNKMFHQMADSYLIEYHADGEGYNDILHVTLSADRGEEYSCATIIHNHTVEKKALYPEGVQRLIRIKSNDDDLTEHGVPMVESTIRNDVYIMPKIDAEILERCMQDALADDVEKFLLLFDKYKDIVYRSSDIVKVDEHGPIMKRCYIDLVPLNCFYKDEQFLFYDQEFYLENEPANLILWRATVIVYDGNPTLLAILPIEKLWDRYGITAHTEEYSRKSSEFLHSIRNQEQLAEFNRKYVRDIGKVMENQRKMEHMLIDWQEQKEKYKETCFDNLEGKEIYIWGSGRYADEFICMYRYDYSITSVLDNNLEKHNTEFYGYSIKSPEILRGKNPETYKVIVCVKNCNELLEQLYDMGVRYIGVFDINYVYPGRQKYLPGHEGLAKNQEFYIAPKVDGLSEKKYHIGYIAGVFDLFHLGHLNMFRRAKEMCDYLIVGVVSDEGVRINKKTDPFIPFDERIEMVRSCRYVDEAAEIPFVYCRTPEAFRKYHFDVQFSGSDYENDPGWLYMKKYLEDHGSTMVFFSYTQQTSSTKIKALIDRNLEHDAPVTEEQKKYKTGYCMITARPDDYKQYQYLKQVADMCEKFILAIPDQTISDKLFGGNAEFGESYDSAAAFQYWSDIRWIHQVVYVSDDNISYQAAYEKYRFDMCCYGSYYGTGFDQDKVFFESKGVDLFSLMPENLGQMTSNMAIKLFLKKNRVGKKLVLFGTGAYFDYFIKNYADDFVPAYAVDNDQTKWGTKKAGIEIKNPETLKEDKDAVVIICAKKFTDLTRQLTSYGIVEFRPLLYRNETALLEDYDLFRTELELSWETLEKIQEINYDMLEEFDKICRKYGIEYSLNYGSLIGTLRHKAFIPWDNDVDTIMTRDNCDKLRAHKDEFSGDKYFWLEPSALGNKKYFDCITRLGYQAAYVRREDDYCEYYENLYNGIHLDMFLIDKTYDDWRGRLQRYELAVLYGLMNAYRHPSFFEDYPPDLMKKNKILCAVGRFIPLRWMQRKADKIARRYSKRDDAPYYFISNDSLRMLSILFPAEDFEEVVDASFGRVTSMVYNGADHICRMNFGDYMQLPPEDARIPHMGRVMLSADQFVFLKPERKI